MRIDNRVTAVGTHERVYFVKSTHGGILVDCGSEKTYGSNMDELRGRGVDTGRIHAILVTHEHFDHIGGIGRAKAELGCAVIAHRLAVDAIETGDPMLTACENPFLGIHEPFLPATVDEAVEEGDTVVVDDLEIDVYHIPGHTPGGAAYLLEGRLFVGDTLFGGGGIGWPDVHWGSCISDHRRSVEKIQRLSPAILLPGHGDPFRLAPGDIHEALRRLDELTEIGVPSKNALPAPTERLREPRSVRLPVIIREAEPASLLSLRNSAAYEFRCKSLFGFIRPSGEYHGLVLFGKDGRPITRPGTCTINLEHYCEEGRAAPFLPRKGCPTYHSVDDGSLTIHFSPTSEWPVDTAITYRPGEGDFVDIDFDFRFGRAFRRFEAFIASYFFDEASAYVRTKEGWRKPSVPSDQQLFFSRDEEAAGQVSDGRWRWLEERGILAKLDPVEYESAMLANWSHGWAFVQMVDPEECPSISINSFAWAQDISLLGVDVEKGEKRTARIRAAYLPIERLEEIDDLYSAFLETRDA